MHRHDHDEHDTDPQLGGRAKAETSDPLLLRAAAAGRKEVLGHQGLLGLQRAAGNAAATTAVEDDAASVHDVVSRGGQPLDEGVRTDMEARMGQDFSDVRVHTDDAAHASARSVSAHAYTVGSDIVFQRGAYDPGSTDGQKTLAHELTHVVQQRSGPVDGTPVGGGISVSDPSDRFEQAAVANADRVMSEPAAVQRHTDPELAGEPASAVQREAAPEEEQEEEQPLQQSHDASLGPVQRQEEDEPEEEGS